MVLLILMVDETNRGARLLGSAQIIAIRNVSP
jgi:hypothetical protein